MTLLWKLRVPRNSNATVRAHHRLLDHPMGDLLQKYAIPSQEELTVAGSTDNRCSGSGIYLSFISLDDTTPVLEITTGIITGRKVKGCINLLSVDGVRCNMKGSSIESIGTIYCMHH